MTYWMVKVMAGTYLLVSPEGEEEDGEDDDIMDGEGDGWDLPVVSPEGEEEDGEDDDIMDGEGDGWDQLLVACEVRTLS